MGELPFHGILTLEKDKFSLLKMTTRKHGKSFFKPNLAAKSFLLLIIFILLCGPANGDQLIDEIAFGLGHSRTGLDIYRVGLIHNFDFKVLNNNLGWLSMYAEASINYWKFDEEGVVTGALSPVFKYYFGAPKNQQLLYLEGGIGVAIVSDTEIHDRDMSTLFQFEDRIGIGIKSTHFDLNVRYMHYSNASVKSPNSGIDIYLFTGTYVF